MNLMPASRSSPLAGLLDARWERPSWSAGTGRILRHAAERKSDTRESGPDIAHEVQQVLGGRPIAADGLHRRTADILMKIEPRCAEVGDRDGLKAQGTGGTDFELAVDLGRHLPGGVPIGADPRLSPLALFGIGQVPDLAAAVRRARARHETKRFSSPYWASFREASRYKPLQKPLQTGAFPGEPRNAKAHVP